MKPGKYIVIEGHDGTGKSTQVSLIRQKLLDHGIESVEFHEPSGTDMSDAIRNILKNGQLSRDGITNTLLFSAARHDIWLNVALPALKSGKWVVAARNYYSTIAYQGYGEGLNQKYINNLTLTSTDSKYMKPDTAVILNLDNETERYNRINKRGPVEKPDNFETKDQDFQQKVKNGYLKIAKNKKIPVISANNTPEDISEQIWQLIEDSLK